jgi:hypothetical protein
MICGGVAEIVFGLSPFLYLSAVAGFVIAATSPLLSAHSQTIWQAQTPRVAGTRVLGAAADRTIYTTHRHSGRRLARRAV